MVTENKKFELKERPPIVVIMGHIDHGKTKLLDYIRNTKVVEKEAGGITQHIGAYEIEEKGKKITFIDTPGHEAFISMRSRGAKVADIAVLVVAADEGVKPQTEESIKIIQEAGIPFIIAINKIDKPEAQPEKVKAELAEKNILVESWGGKVPSVEISAKMGQNVDSLLDLILLVAEMEELKADSAKPAEAIVIESHLDPRKGAVATLLIRDGFLKVGDWIVCGSLVGKIKMLEDFKGKAVAKASFSSPVRIVGFSSVPAVGDSCNVYKDKSSAESASKLSGIKAADKIEGIKNQELKGKKIKQLNIILKADVSGSLEAISESLEKMSYPEVKVKIVKGEVGDINESDLKLGASLENCLIAAFKTKIQGQITQVAQNLNIKIISSDIIYKLLDDIKKEMEAIIEPEMVRRDLGELEVLAIFGVAKSKQVIGGKVISGVIKKGSKVEVLRRGEKVGKGKITQLQKQKKDVVEVGAIAECGMLFDGDVKIVEKDKLAIYEEEMIKKKLD